MHFSRLTIYLECELCTCEDNPRKIEIMVEFNVFINFLEGISYLLSNMYL